MFCSLLQHIHTAFTCCMKQAQDRLLVQTTHLQLILKMIVLVCRLSTIHNYTSHVSETEYSTIPSFILFPFAVLFKS